MSNIDNIVRLFHSEDETNKILAIQLFISQEEDLDGLVEGICNYPDVDHTEKIHVINGCEFFPSKKKKRGVISFVCNDLDKWLPAVSTVLNKQVFWNKSTGTLPLDNYMKEYTELMKRWLEIVIEKQTNINNT